MDISGCWIFDMVHWHFHPAPGQAKKILQAQCSRVGNIQLLLKKCGSAIYRKDIWFAGMGIDLNRCVFRSQQPFTIDTLLIFYLPADDFL